MEEYRQVYAPYRVNKTTIGSIGSGLTEFNNTFYVPLKCYVKQAHISYNEQGETVTRGYTLIFLREVMGVLRPIMRESDFIFDYENECLDFCKSINKLIINNNVSLVPSKYQHEERYFLMKSEQEVLKLYREKENSKEAEI